MKPLHFYFFTLFFFFTSCSQSFTANSRSVLGFEFSSSKLTPTVYYLHLIYLENKKCSAKDSSTFYEESQEKDKPDKKIATVCTEDYNKCVVQGSCLVYNSKKAVGIGFRKRTADKIYWHTFNRSECPYGKGHRGACVDPYYSVAADNEYWKSGDVIFVPEVRGIVLPDGSTHSGFFVVRDTGGQIIGPHRFDFYIGYSSNYNKSNPFIQLKLNDKNTQLEYRKATEQEREIILKERNYPLIPDSKVSNVRYVQN